MPQNDNSAPTLNELTAVKRLEAPTDGRLEIALAIAGTTQLVTVDPTQHPFVTTPPNLFDLTFDDPQVGINDSQMEVFKANLTLLLPQIKSDIAQIPDVASNKIDDVAQFIELSLQAAGGGA